MRPDLLQCLEDAKREVKVSGVGSTQLTIRTTGYLNNFFHMYASEDTKVNILCFVDVEDAYDIIYTPWESFTMHLLDRDIVFCSHGKLYI
jgi:hypothetical protein